MSTTTIPAREELTDLLGRLRGDASALSDGQRIDLIGALEELKAGAAAAQARLTVAFDASQRREQAAQGVPASKQGLGVHNQVALARRDSPHKGSRHLGFARALVREMPCTLAALAAGEISEWRATIMVRETATLSAVHRGEVDRRLAGRLVGLGDRGVQREAKKLAYALDPGSVVRRMRRAGSERRVSVRPAPDTMSYVTGLLPVAQGVAVYAALTRHAESRRAAGDPRSRGQIMADTFVERLTGQAQAPAVPVEIQLVMTDRTLFGVDDSPGRIVGHGPVPAALARALAGLSSSPGIDPSRAAGRGAGSAARDDAAAGEAAVWLRRLFRNPVTGDLVAMDSRRREFPQGLRHFFTVRDDICRTPWCDAPIRHADHVVRAADGGETSAANGQGLCEACNQAKEALGWLAWTPSRQRAGPVTRRTPTGHRYTSRPPDPPGRRPVWADLRHLLDDLGSPLEDRLALAHAPA